MSKKLRVVNYKRLVIDIICLILIIVLIVIIIKNKNKSKEVSQMEMLKIENAQPEISSQILTGLFDENSESNIINMEISQTISKKDDTNTILQNSSEDNNTNIAMQNTLKEDDTNTVLQNNSSNTDNNTNLQNNSGGNEVNETSKNKSDDKKNISSDLKYYIKINVQENVVNIFEKDDNGEYIVPVKAMLCSTGIATPEAGEIYTMPNDKWNRLPWGTMKGGVYAQYYSRITGSILFHSVPYIQEKKSTLEYEEYDKLGTKASAGCIRLTVINAKWIYDNCPPGTQVEFYASDDPGPFGKPTEQKISNADEKLRGWDPTDPDKNNPWNLLN